MTTKRWESLEVTWGYSRIIFKMRLLYCIVCYSDMVNRYPSRSQLHFLPGVHIMFQNSGMNSNIQTFTPNIWQKRLPHESCKISTPSHFPKLNLSSFLIMEVGDSNFINKGGKRKVLHLLLLSFSVFVLFYFCFITSPALNFFPASIVWHSKYGQIAHQFKLSVHWFLHVLRCFQWSLKKYLRN